MHSYYTVRGDTFGFRKEKLLRKDPADDVYINVNIPYVPLNSQQHKYCLTYYAHVCVRDSVEHEPQCCADALPSLNESFRIVFFAQTEVRQYNAGSCRVNMPAEDELPAPVCVKKQHFRLILSLYSMKLPIQ